MPLRRSAGAAGALLLAVPLLSACSNGMNVQTNREYTPAAGANNRDAGVDILGAVVVSGQQGSGTFIATLVNNSAGSEAAVSSVAAGPDGRSVKAGEFSPVTIPARGEVNLATDQGAAIQPIVLTGDFEAGQYVELVLGLADGETVTMDVPVVSDDGYFQGLDSSA